MNHAIAKQADWLTLGFPSVWERYLNPARISQLRHMETVWIPYGIDPYGRMEGCPL